MTETTRPTLLEFPTRFPIKIMGSQHPEFVSTMVSLTQTHAPDFDTSLTPALNPTPAHTPKPQNTPNTLLPLLSG